MFGRRNPRSLPPFQKGELSSSKLNSLRIAASKRIRGLFGRESSSSASTSPTKQQSLRERLFALNNTGQSIPAFSIFAVKKSGDIDYAWGPPVHTEGNKFEHGFVYYTNGDFEIANGEGHWCQVVGDLPTMIRSAIGTDATDEETKPKIGHPIGPLEDGTLSIERCGYVVVAEPWLPGDMGLDDNYVWVTKANDQAIRVKLKEDINQRKRGKVCVLPVPPEDLECDGCTRTEEPGSFNPESCSVKDPNTIAPDPGFEIRKIINLTRRDLKADQIVYIHPVLGIGYAILETDPGHYKAKIGANDLHHLPSHDDSPHCAELMIFDSITEDWINVKDDEGENLRIGVWDRNNDNCVLIGEMHDILPTYDKRGCAKWHWVGQHGLTREVEIQANIQQNASGVAFISKHENELCPGIVLPDASIDICNKGSILNTGDIAIAFWLEDVWVVLDHSDVVGTIAFTMITDRTREVLSGNNFGRATVLITDVSGTTPNAVGDVVEVFFVNKRWLESVAGCQGRADIIGGIYHVVEVQGKTQGFSFRTLEPRVGTGDQDVLVEVIQSIGHANDDLPPAQSGQQSGQSQCGSLTIQCIDPDPSTIELNSRGERVGIWTVTSECGEGCDIEHPGYRGVIGQRCILGYPPYVYPCYGSPSQEDPPSSSIYVRYRAGTYPHMLAGAIGYAQLDNDISNTTDNSTMRYYAVESDQMTKFIRYDHPKFCPFTNFTPTGVAAMDFFPFSQLPTGPITVYDIVGDASMGGQGFARWDESQGIWISVRATLEELEFLMEGPEDQNGCITFLKQKVSIGRCVPPTASVLAFGDVLSSVEFTLTMDASGSSSCENPVFALLYRSIKAITCGVQSEVKEASRLIPEKKTVISSINMDGCPMWVSQSILVFPGCDDATLHEADCTEYVCPTGSGSEGSEASQ